MPLALKPWLVAALRQDKLICQAASAFLTFDPSSTGNSPVEYFDPEDWTPAAIALRSIAPTLSTKWLCTNPMPELDDEIRQHAELILNTTTFPSENWSLEKAGWIALALRSEYLAKKTWKPILDAWLSDPDSQHGTILACLYGMIADPQALFRAVLLHNPSSHNIAIVLHAVLSNPRLPEYLDKILEAIKMK